MMVAVTFLLVTVLGVGLMLVLCRRAPAGPGATRLPVSSAALVVKGPEDDPGWGLSGGGAWTALDELQLTRLLKDSAS